MSYPVITIEKAQELADLLRSEVNSILNGGDPFGNFTNESDWVLERAGESYERNLVEKCAADLRSETVKALMSSGPPPASVGYLLEAKMAGEIHNALRHCKMDVLEDEDFWRYLALFPFRWYLVAREPELQPQDFGGFTEIKDKETGISKRRSKSMITQLIYRTYLWGKIAYDESAKNKYARATVVAEVGGPSIDVWHSHLIRTQLGQLGRMPHSFVDIIVQDVSEPTQMKTPARETEKLIARIKHNVVLDIYEKDEADLIVREQLGRIK